MHSELFYVQVMKDKDLKRRGYVYLTNCLISGQNGMHELALSYLQMAQYYEDKLDEREYLENGRDLGQKQKDDWS